MDDNCNGYSTPFDHPLSPRCLIEVRDTEILTVRTNAQAPVNRLPVRDVVEGFYWRVSFVLPFGEVIHDYLAPSEAPHA